MEYLKQTLNLNRLWIDFESYCTRVFVLCCEIRHLVIFKGPLILDLQWKHSASSDKFCSDVLNVLVFQICFTNKHHYHALTFQLVLLLTFYFTNFFLSFLWTISNKISTNFLLIWVQRPLGHNFKSELLQLKFYAINFS